MRRLILFITLYAVALGLFSYKAMTYALFSDTATSQNNTFAAASIFPTGPSDTPTPTPTGTPSPTPTPENIANHIVISEVQIDGGPSDADHDFIELYNPTSSQVDLNGHRLVSRTGNSPSDDLIKSFTTSTLIQAHGFYLWARNSDTAFPSTIGADASTSASLTSSMSIALRNGPDNTGTIIDALSWNNGSTFGEGTNAEPPSDNGSLERKALSTSSIASMTGAGSDIAKGNGYDTDNNSTDFILRPASQPQNSSSATESP